MSGTICSNLLKNAQKTITSLLKRHGFKADQVSSQTVKETKHVNNLEINIRVDYTVCSDNPKDNKIKIDGIITSDTHDHSMRKHEVRFDHEELLPAGNEVKTIEMVLEFILNQQELYTVEVSKLK